MVMKFATYYEATKIAKELDDINLYDGVYSIFVCKDTNDFWIAKIYKDTNEEFETEEGTWLIERNKLDHGRVGFAGIKTAIKLDLDDTCAWDNREFYSYDECIQALDDGYGIIYESSKKEGR